MIFGELLIMRKIKTIIINKTTGYCIIKNKTCTRIKKLNTALRQFVAVLKNSLIKQLTINHTIEIINLGNKYGIKLKNEKCILDNRAQNIKLKSTGK